VVGVAVPHALSTIAAATTKDANTNNLERNISFFSPSEKQIDV
jgi:hypothetical protein